MSAKKVIILKNPNENVKMLWRVKMLPLVKSVDMNEDDKSIENSFLIIG